MICRPCIGLPCDNPPDLASGIDGAIYSALDLSFIVQCPPLCYCPPSLFPRTISILASTIPPVVPPILEPGDAIILRLQGCSALITRTLPFGSTQAAIAAAAQSMQAEWAGQQALCIAQSTPGVNCTPSNSITICNDAHSFLCPYTGVTYNVPAGLYCQTLATTGLTSDQIASQSAAIKANLTHLADTSFCTFLGVICALQSTETAQGVNDIQIYFTNVGNNVVDISNFNFCIGATCPPFPPAFTTINPHTGPLLWNGAFNGVPSAFSLTNNGLVFYSHGPAPNTLVKVFVTVGCA